MVGRERDGEIEVRVRGIQELVRRWNERMEVVNARRRQRVRRAGEIIGVEE